ncbi:MAG: Rv1355c family protein [Mucilaginibacter sp.]|uniref:Rv1355c family protein n=1 Tax=Mucilaginibacter sp. TaxID=1882438 RepID=UPI0034E5E408
MENSYNKAELHYKPQFFDINIAEDKERYNLLLKTNPFIQVYNEIEGQLREFIKVKNPTKRIKPTEYPALIQDYLNGKDIYDYGIWVYYHWSNRLVHVLPKNEFIELRTAANRNKITKQEQDILNTKKVGIIGLSVGQSVAVTMALERACSELRLADFDTLELNNLNRIRTGIHNLGLLKAYSVAREIAEIDPFINTICYTEGITENNINDFLTNGGKLDAVIDECDGIDIKILCRIKAKELQIPVIMEASDRGTVDVERFDLEPERPIMHGWLEHLNIDFNVLKNLKTSEEKIPYMLPISGFDTLTLRMKASMTEIESTITTWPQLASAVTLGGGIATDVCRRVFLNEFNESGRYFVDLEVLIANKKVIEKQPHLSERAKNIQENEMQALIVKADVKLTEEQLNLDQKTIEEVVGAAIAAPTGGNAQPWKWKYQNKNLYLFYNSEYKVQLIDSDKTASFIGFGTATENLVLKAHELNLEVKSTLFPLGVESDLIAAYSFFSSKNNNIIENLEPHLVDELAKAIPLRVANRKLTSRIEIEEERLIKISDYVKTVPGAELKLITDSEYLDKVGEIIAKAERIRLMNKGGHIDFLSETMWTDEEAEITKRGVAVTSLDLTPSEQVGLKIISDWEVVKHLNNWEAGRGLEKLSKKSTLSASAIGLITMPEQSMLNFLQGGRAVERAWLAATNEKIAFQPLSISIFLFNRLNSFDNLFSKKEVAELLQMKTDFENLFSIEEKEGKIFLFRLFITDTTPKPSLRVPIKEVLSLS